MRIELKYKPKASLRPEVTIIIDGKKKIVMEILEVIEKTMEKYDWLELV